MSVISWQAVVSRTSSPGDGGGSVGGLVNAHDVARVARIELSDSQVDGDRDMSQLSSSMVSHCLALLVPG